MTLHKIWGMGGRYLRENEVNWLRNHRKDPRPAVREAAIEVHRVKFPRYERNMAKKGMTVFSLELFIHDEICGEWGDWIPVHVRIFAEDTGAFRYINYDEPEEAREKSIVIEKKDARRFLKAVVHASDAPFWDEDYRERAYDEDPYLDVLPEFRPAFDAEEAEEMEEEPAPESVEEEKGEPLCTLRLELNTGAEKEIAFYSQVPDVAADLFWSLLGHFEPEDEDWERDEPDSE